MSIIGNTKQNRSRTLEGFYMNFANDKNPSWAKIGNDMLDFLGMINQTFKETIIWGLTSHEYLILQTKDDYESDSFVVINSSGDKEYHFDHQKPSDKNLKTLIRIKGQTKSLEDAKKYLLIAMKESGGWTDNTELKKLLLDNDL